MPRPSHISDKYVLLRPIAVGGMSEVFLARQTGLEGFEKLVVLKRILPQLAEQDRYVEMFLDEARTAADLRHTNLVNIFEVGEDQYGWFIAMEYLHGRTVRELLKALPSGEPLPVNHAVQIVLDAASGLSYAHRKTDMKGRPLRIVHRDIKPANLMVTFEGITKVLDFGIARAQTKTHQTAAGKITGTLRYMSPEQGLGRKVSAHSDQFSLGVVLYQMTTQHRLFDGDTDQDILQAVVRCDVPPPSTIIDGYPRELESIVMRTLSRDPAARFNSCGELADALVAFTDTERMPHSPLHLARFLTDLFPRATETYPEATSGSITDDPGETRTDIDGARGAAGPAWVVRDNDGDPAATTADATGPTGPRVLTNLSSDPTLFVGRVRDLESLSELRDAGGRLITLLGPGGAGKSRLSRRFGTLSLRDDRFSSAWFCDLAPVRDLAGILSVVSAVLQVPLTASLEDAAAVQLLGRAIAGRGDTLIILDNFEQITDFGPAVVSEWMALAPEATFLVTSRELLRLPGEVPQEVGALSLPAEDDGNAMRSEAVQLFVDRARGVRPGYQLSDEDGPVVSRIVRKLDGLPLAIELAAARMGVFTPSDLLERMPKRFKLLKGARRDATDRQNTLRATIDWSWSLLEPWEQTALAQASVFRGGFPLPAAEYVLDLSAHADSPWVADVVQSLCDKSLLRRQDVGGDLRFTMYESIREYASEKENGADAAANRHSAYYLQICGQMAQHVYTHGGLDRLRALAAERENLIGILERAVDASQPQQALQAILTLDPVLSARGPLHTHLALLDRALETPGAADVEPALLIQVLEARGKARRAAGRTDESVEDFERAHELAQKAGEQGLRGRALRYLGTLHQLRGQVEDAHGHYTSALEIHRSVGDRRFEGLSLGSLAVLDLELGRLEEAATHFEEAVELLREVGDQTSEGVYHGNLGAVHQLQGETDAARRHYEQALEVHRRVGNRRFEGMVMGYLGSLHHDSGTLEEAQKYYEEALVILREVGDRRFEGMFLGYVGIVLQERTALTDARTHYENAVELLHSVGDRRLEGMFLGFRGGLHAVDGEIAEAKEALDTAEEMIRGAGDPLLLHTVLINRGHLELALSRRSAGQGDVKASETAREAARTRVTDAKSRLPPDEEHPGGAPAPADQSDDIRFALRLLNQALQEA